MDIQGTLSAGATDWYTADHGGVLILNGDRTESAPSDPFQRSAAEAVLLIAPAFSVSDRSQYLLSRNGCVSHRYAVFAYEEDQIVVSAWRVVSAADPNWVPNEAPFVPLDESTLVSRGEHIEVVLSVAPDGTTVRVTSYGARAANMVSGWPTTTPSLPSTPPPGPAPATIDDLVQLARTVLGTIIDQR